MNLATAICTCLIKLTAICLPSDYFAIGNTVQRYHAWSLSGLHRWRSMGKLDAVAIFHHGNTSSSFRTQFEQRWWLPEECHASASLANLSTVCQRASTTYWFQALSNSSSKKPCGERVLSPFCSLFLIAKTKACELYNRKHCLASPEWFVFASYNLVL